MSETKLGTSQLGNDAIVWNDQNFIAGSNVSISKVDRPYIDENTLAVYHFGTDYHNSVPDSILGDACTDDGGWTWSTTVSRFTGGGSVATGDLVNRGVRNLLPKTASGVGTGDFSVDLWIYVPTDLYFYNSSYGVGAVGLMYNGNYFAVRGNSASTLKLFAIGNNESDSWSMDIEAQKWYHLAYERYNGQFYFYVDGKFVFRNYTTNSTNIDTAYVTSNGTYYIRGCSTGRSVSGYQSAQGMWMSEVRFSNTARWKGNDFTLFEQPYQEDKGLPDIYALSADNYSAGTNVQIDVNKVISATDTTYSGGNGIKIANTVVSVDQEKVWTPDNFLEGSGIEFEKLDSPVIDSATFRLYHFDGNLKDEISGDTQTTSSIYYADSKFGKGVYSTLNSGSSTFGGSYNWNNGDKTIDVWLKPRDASSDSVLLSLYSYDSRERYATAGMTFYNPAGSNHKISISKTFTGTGENVTLDWQDTSIIWGNPFHVAWENDGTNGYVYLYVNGVRVYSASKTATVNTNASVSTNTYSNTIYDELRLSNSVRWTADRFTPWDVPYSANGIVRYKINATGGGGSINPVTKTFNKAADVTTIDTGLDLSSYSLVLVYSNGLCLSEDPVVESGESTESGESGAVETNDYYISGSSIIFHEGFAAKIKVVCM